MEYDSKNGLALLNGLTKWRSQVCNGTAVCGKYEFEYDLRNTYAYVYLLCRQKHSSYSYFGIWSIVLGRATDW